jgi:Fe2+ or Zn2+ uptake regulation protein
MRQTLQKKILREELVKFNSFFDGSDLYKKASKRNHKIGVATVYRFLKKLVEAGEIHSYLCEKRTIYSRNKNNHCHFVCKKCGEIKHFQLKHLDFLDIKGEVCHFQIDVNGICEKCLRE